MRLNTRELLIFGAKVLGALLLLAVLWPLIAGGYSQLLAAMVGWWMPQTQIQVDAHQMEIIIRHGTPAPGGMIAVTKIRTTVILGAIVFNLLLLCALMIATPRLGVWRRLGLLTAALILQMGFHLVDITLSVGANYESVVHQKTSLYGLAQLVGGVGEQASALIIWALLTFRYWFPKPTLTPVGSPKVK